MRVRVGDKFWGPNSQGYEVVKDFGPMTPIMPDYFRAIGGAPEPRAGEQVPPWLMTQVKVVLRCPNRVNRDDKSD